MALLRLLERCESEADERCGAFQSLFIHVPPFAVIDEEHQLNFVRECLRYLREHVQPPQND